MGETLEHLIAVALIDKDGITHHGFKEHWALRAHLGRTDPYQKDLSDEYGFWTSEGRFVSRHEAMHIGAKVGQCQIMGRELLSSDVRWEPISAAKAAPSHMRTAHGALKAPTETREQRRNRERRERKAAKSPQNPTPKGADRG